MLAQSDLMCYAGWRRFPSSPIGHSVPFDPDYLDCCCCGPVRGPFSPVLCGMLRSIHHSLYTQTLRDTPFTYLAGI